MHFKYEAVRTLLEGAVMQGEIPGGVAVAGTHEESAFVAAYGNRRYPADGETAPAVTPETVYDLASLTKVIATLPGILKLVDAGDVTLDDSVERFFSNVSWLRTTSLMGTTVRQLLTHSAGLPAGRLLLALTGKRETVLMNVMQMELEHPAGRYVYSDLGFILLGSIIEQVSGMREDAFVKREIFEPLGMHDTSYGPVTGVSVAATEDCSWRRRLLEGEVHDENAFMMEGVAGHAGLFSNADDLARYAQAWLNLDARLGSEDLLREAVREQLAQAGVRRGLGWMLKGEGSGVGTLASPRAFGHTGFTGTSLWCDPEQDWFAVLLTNRVHPSRTRGQNIQALRASFCEAVAQTAAAS